MKIAIEKIKVSERIRKEVTKIDELAADIAENGLYNAITVMPLDNGEYQLLAGLRRLKAGQSLGWTEIAVNSISPKDAEQRLRIEISENEQREPFTYSEKMDYARLFVEIEKAKALERKSMGGKGGIQDTPPGAYLEKGESRQIIAEKIGMGKTTYDRARYIANNATPEQIEQLDKGEKKIKTVYNEIKSAKSGFTAEEQNAFIKQSRDSDKRIRNSYSDPTIVLTSEEKKLKKQREAAVAESPQAKRLWSEWEERQSQNTDTATTATLPQKADVVADEALTSKTSIMSTKCANVKQTVSPKMERLHEQETERIRKLREYEALPPEGKIVELKHQIEEQRVRAVRAESELEDFKYKTHNQIYHRDCKLENLQKRNEELAAKYDEFSSKYAEANHKRGMLETQLHNTNLQWQCEREGKNGHIAELTAKVAELNAALTAANAKIAELETMLNT